MARSIAQDYLQDYAFWLFDIVNVPVNGALSYPMLNPLIGFSTVTAPEFSLETEEISQADWYFTKPVIKKANVSPITLTRGVTFYDNDFYNWVTSALKGGNTITEIAPRLIDSPFSTADVLQFNSQEIASNQALRRDLILVQFFPRFPRVPAGSLSLGPAPTVIAPQHPRDDAYREPARAFYIKGAIPTRYKPNSDFDAQSSAISIQELDLAYEYFEQVGFNVSLAVK